MIAFADAGITTFDCADIYTGVEELIGEFRHALPRPARPAGAGAHQGAHQVRARSRHAAAHHQVLCRGRHRHARCGGCGWSGWISCSSIGGTMPCRAGWRPRIGSRSCAAPARSTRSAAPISTPGACVEMVESGVPLASMQVQYSLLDRRPRKAMVAAALKHGVALLCYGTVAGGFLSDRWLGAPEPKAPAWRTARSPNTGWSSRSSAAGTLFQSAARDAARDRAAATAATSRRWRAPRCLEWPSVAAVIVGARNRSHLPANLGGLRASP